MSQEKVREILSHVDMTKIDLSSFKISEKKFNELAALYKNRVILACVSIIACKDEDDRESIDQAFDVIKKIAANPDLYSYWSIYNAEQKDVNAAINEITNSQDRSISAVHVKATEFRMKAAYKHMRKAIETALENGNSFECEFDEAAVERCLKVTTDAIESGRKKAEEEYAASQSIQSDSALANEETHEEVMDIATDEPSESARPIKVTFWKRIFGNRKAVRV